jgi:hypothetical protein
MMWNQREELHPSEKSCAGGDALTWRTEFQHQYLRFPQKSLIDGIWRTWIRSVADHDCTKTPSKSMSYNLASNLHAVTENATNQTETIAQLPDRI